MTTLQDKTPEELNVICAELCGWKCVDDGSGYKAWQLGNCRPVQVMFEPNLDKDGDPCFPPYATSYDAIMGECHKVDEKLLRDSLAKVLNCAWYQSAKLLRASPADLTRALILVLQSK